jgi:glycerate dehydrogenase
MSQEKLHLVFLDRETISPQTVLRPFQFEHTIEVFERTTPQEIASRITHADIVITNKAKLGAEAIAGAKRLRMVAVAATGTDVVDLAACSARNVVVTNIRDYAANTVSEHTIALIFALRRSLVAYSNAVARGRWQDSRQFCFFDYPIQDLKGSTIGIIGDGVLGRAVGALAAALGINVLFAAHKGRSDMGPLYTQFEDVLRDSDVITLHCPLTPATRNMIAAPEFDLMQRKPLIINTARGGLVDERALVQALREGKISGAGFDVTVQEPPPEDHPFMELRNTPNFILTPHVAWASNEAVQSLTDQLVDNIEAFVRGRARNVVA